MKRDCPYIKGPGRNEEDSVFAAGEIRSSGWMIDSGATAHMTPHREYLFDYKNLMTSIEVTIADGKKIRVLHIPGLDRRLLSVGKLAERGLNVEFERTSCIIWKKNQAAASGKKVGKAYILECQQETAQYVEYSDVDSNYDLWHARMGHLNKDALEKTQRVTTGIPINNFKTKALCTGCLKPRLDHLRVFGSIGCAHVDDAKRTKLEPKSFKCMFLGYGDNTKGYRVYDLELNKVKMSRSVKLDEREVNKRLEVINVIKDIEEVTQPENEKEYFVEDEPMESTADPFNDVEMQEDEHDPMASGRELTTYHRQHESTANGDMVFRPEKERSRRPREPSLLLGNGLIMAEENTMDSDDDPDNVVEWDSQDCWCDPNSPLAPGRSTNGGGTPISCV
ncbi:hypothetical protein DD237_003846 [Peronospora effusa]|uniref:Uncharacterized protein n=1 Tax=Peronospora effusa TaxID=542832 RepID=A0A425C8P2_9STRA|nr:hypothetical protein DD237_003846 [Peronospora effusa]